MDGSEGRPGRLSSLSSAGQGLLLFLASLSVLFIASLVAVVITRTQAPLWKTPEMPDLPLGLLLSTGLLAALSLVLEHCRANARRNHLLAVERGLFSALLLAAAFLLAQSFNWVEMARGYRAAHLTLYPFTFHLLTGLHAVHVLGGMLPLALVTWRAGRREYSSSWHEGLTLCAWYWHYLGGVWLVLLGALWLMR